MFSTIVQSALIFVCVGSLAVAQPPANSPQPAKDADFLLRKALLQNQTTILHDTSRSALVRRTAITVIVTIATGKKSNNSPPPANNLSLVATDALLLQAYDPSISTAVLPALLSIVKDKDNGRKNLGTSKTKEVVEHMFGVANEPASGAILHDLAITSLLDVTKSIPPTDVLKDDDLQKAIADSWNSLAVVSHLSAAQKKAAISALKEKGLLPTQAAHLEGLVRSSATTDLRRVAVLSLIAKGNEALVLVSKPETLEDAKNGKEAEKKALEGENPKLTQTVTDAKNLETAAKAALDAKKPETKAALDAAKQKVKTAEENLKANHRKISAADTAIAALKTQLSTARVSSGDAALKFREIVVALDGLLKDAVFVGDPVAHIVTSNAIVSFLNSMPAVDAAAGVATTEVSQGGDSSGSSNNGSNSSNTLKMSSVPTVLERLQGVASPAAGQSTRKALRYTGNRMQRGDLESTTKAEKTARSGGAVGSLYAPVVVFDEDN